MGRKSSLHDLPPAARVAWDEAIRRGATLDEIVAAIKAAGGQMSRSAAHRARLSVEATAAKMREAREIATALTDGLGGSADNKVSRLATELLQSAVFRVAVELEDSESEDLPTDIARLSKALKDLSTASALDADREMKIRAAARKEALEEAAAKLKASAARSGGLSKEAAGALIKDFLGL